MCGIAITKYKNILDTFDRQIDRGTDSIWLITNSTVYRNAANYKKYIRYFKNTLDKEINKDELVIFHHRAASIGKVNIDNTHPFKGNNFLLIHNWTSRKIFKELKDQYKEEVDSLLLLRIIEDFTDKISEIPDVLDFLLSEYNDILGTVIIQDFRTGETLVYSDGERETDITIKNNKLVSLYNYAPWKSSWFENKGWLIFNQNNWIIKENTFVWLNTKKFIKPFVQTTTKYYDDFYSYPTYNTKRLSGYVYNETTGTYVRETTISPIKTPNKKTFYELEFSDIPKHRDIDLMEVDELDSIRDFMNSNRAACKMLNFSEFAHSYYNWVYWIDSESFEFTFGFNLDDILLYCFYFYNY